MKFLTRYRKFIVALVPVGLGVLAHYVGGASFVYSEVVAALVALGVYAVPNEPPAPPAA